MRALAAAALALLLPGCTALRGVAWTREDVAASGQGMDDYRLREAIAGGRFDTAIARATRKERGAPQDRLLRSLYAGTVAYYAGRWDESAQALRRAAEMAEDRYTKSLSKGAAALVSNDRVLPYAPGRTERLLVHYYGMLGRARAGDTLGAAVEARRLGALLERYREGRLDGEKPAHAALHYAAGVVFEMAGERNDADVAYRNAAALSGDSLFASAAEPAAPRPAPAPTRLAAASKRGGARAAAPLAPPAPPAATGEVVVLLEHGWVAHRVEDALVVGLDSGDVAVFAAGGGRSRHGHHHDAHSRPVGAAERILAALDGGDGHDWRGRRSRTGVRAGDGGRVLTVAWPRLAAPAREARCAVVVVDTLPPVRARALANLSDAAAADFRRQRALMLARTIARATAKSALSRQAERKGGAALGTIASVGASLLEHADLRSWQLLPNDVAVARLRLPVGRHAVHAVVEDDRGIPRRVDIGVVDVREGALSLLTARAW